MREEAWLWGPNVQLSIRWTHRKSTRVRGAMRTGFVPGCGTLGSTRLIRAPPNLCGSDVGWGATDSGATKVGTQVST
jgi:hypothetical protein